VSFLQPLITLSPLPEVTVTWDFQDYPDCRLLLLVNHHYCACGWLASSCLFVWNLRSHRILVVLLSASLSDVSQWDWGLIAQVQRRCSCTLYQPLGYACWCVLFYLAVYTPLLHVKQSTAWVLHILPSALTSQGTGNEDLRVFRGVCNPKL